MQLSDAGPLVGQLFDVPSDVEGTPYVQLTLVLAEPRGKAHEGRAEPFELIFEGPSTHPVHQDTYTLRNETIGEEEIFIVPISDDGTVIQYQAIFN